MFKKYSNWWYRSFWKKVSRMHNVLGKYQVVLDKSGRTEHPYIIREWNVVFELWGDFTITYKTEQDAIDSIYSKRLSKAKGLWGVRENKRKVVNKIP